MEPNGAQGQAEHEQHTGDHTAGRQGWAERAGEEKAHDGKTDHHHHDYQQQEPGGPSG
jgi:hypothetical protein